jgi:hypothetical protein
MHVSGQLYNPARGHNPRYPLDRRLGGHQSRSGHCGVEEISCPCRGSNPGRPARSPSLYRLCYLFIDWKALGDRRDGGILGRQTERMGGGWDHLSIVSNDKPLGFTTRALELCLKVLTTNANILKTDRHLMQTYGGQLMFIHTLSVPSDSFYTADWSGLLTVSSSCYLQACGLITVEPIMDFLFCTLERRFCFFSTVYVILAATSTSGECDRLTYIKSLDCTRFPEAGRYLLPVALYSTIVPLQSRAPIGTFLLHVKVNLSL